MHQDGVFCEIIYLVSCTMDGCFCSSFFYYIKHNAKIRLVCDAKAQSIMINFMWNQKRIFSSYFQSEAHSNFYHTHSINHMTMIWMFINIPLFPPESIKYLDWRYFSTYKWSKPSRQWLKNIYLIMDGFKWNIKNYFYIKTAQ